jgi:hypothetical protein
MGRKELPKTASNVAVGYETKYNTNRSLDDQRYPMRLRCDYTINKLFVLRYSMVKTYKMST